MCEKDLVNLFFDKLVGKTKWTNSFKNDFEQMCAKIGQ